jgi:hypothetical protein
MFGRIVKVAMVGLALAAGTATTVPAATADSRAAVRKVRLFELTTAGDQGFFYTASASEKAQAISRFGFKPTQTPMPSISATRFPGGVPLYRLKQNGHASYIVSLAPEARKLSADGFTNEGVLGYVGGKGRAGADTGLWRLSYQGKWRLAVTSHMRKILSDEQPAWHLDGQVGDGWGPAVNSDI